MQIFAVATSSLVLFLVVDQATSQDFIPCNPISGSFDIAGAASVERLANAWIEEYQTECSTSVSDASAIADRISVEGGGSSSGASRACGTSTSDQPVDIGGMSRSLNSGEASTDNDWEYQCERSTRELIKVQVASEGISIATQVSGTAAECIKVLKGLTLDQIRWIFSSYDDDTLMNHGWNPFSVPNSDNDPTTHLWSELDILGICPEEEIIIGGLGEDSQQETGNHALFFELIFRGRDETFDWDRAGNILNATSDDGVLNVILDNEAAIAPFGLAYTVTSIDQELVNLVPILEDQRANEGVKPSAASFAEGTYPLLRPLYMNLYNTEESLENTRPFLDFGYSTAGDNALKAIGFWPIEEWEKMVMRTRIQTNSGIPKNDITKHCGPAGDVTVAGSSTVFPVATSWAETYQIGCPSTSFVIEGGGSSVGAGRVCGYSEKGTPVDIGDMSRPWKESEADEIDGFLYSCLKGDTSRSAIQIDVAIDGLTVAVKEGGFAWECIEKLGGLTVDQLRWMYTSYSDAQLEETGWDPKSLKNSDRNSQTHLWSELHPECPVIEIRIAGADDQSGTYEYFLETILLDHDNGETFDLNRPGFGYENSEFDEDLVAYLQEYSESISYFGYSYYYANRNTLSAVAIENEAGEYILPNEASIGDGSYNPLSRRIFMNLLNDESALQNTARFVEFGLRNPELVESTGYVPLPSEAVEEMVGRLNGGKKHSLDGTDDDEGDGLSGGVIAGIVVAAVVGCCFIAAILYMCFGGSDKRS